VADGLSLVAAMTVEVLTAHLSFQMTLHPWCDYEFFI
jgi:hypothetical protein